MEEKIAGFSALINKHSVVGIDTMAFIYHFEKNQIYVPLTNNLFSSVEQGTIKAVTSCISKLEILVKPKRDGKDELVKTYTYLLDTFPNLKLVDLTSKIAEQAAELRAVYNLATPDAIQISSALAEEATCYITNDDYLQRINELSVLILKDWVE